MTELVSGLEPREHPVAMPRVVVMGVSGSGKTTVGIALAGALGVPFIDADDLHSIAAKTKMAAGQVLWDRDRIPWLRDVGAALAAHSGGVVIACSALKVSYRDLLRAAEPDVVFVHLVGDRELIAERMARREHEFMPASLLASQLRTLESLEEDESGMTVDIARAPEEIAQHVLAWLRLTCPEPGDPGSGSDLGTANHQTGPGPEATQTQEATSTQEATQ